MKRGREGNVYDDVCNKDASSFQLESPKTAGPFSVLRSQCLLINNKLVRLTIGLTIFLFMASACHKQPSETLSPALDQAQILESLAGYEIIGEGSDFLTLKIDLPGPLPAGSKIYALAMDEAGYPLRKISGFFYDPKLEGRNHYWFYLFLYSPRPWPEDLRKSSFIKFVYLENGLKKAEKLVEHFKTWGGGDRPTIYDLPAPPDTISGFLIIKDYTFLAAGDFRQPDGYYVEGAISGKEGRWDSFEAKSEIKGREPEPELVLTSDRGWLELNTGRTHGMQEAVAPQVPYVNGWWDSKGYFHPDPLKIFWK